MLTKRFSRVFLFAMALLALLPMSSAMAKEVDKLQANNGPWMSIVVIVLLMVVVGMGSFRSSKRSHLD